jgi:hypothetical protein
MTWLHLSRFIVKGVWRQSEWLIMSHIVQICTYDITSGERFFACGTCCVQNCSCWLHNGLHYTFAKLKWYCKCKVIKSERMDSQVLENEDLTLKWKWTTALVFDICEKPCQSWISLPITWDILNLTNSSFCVLYKIGNLWESGTLNRPNTTFWKSICIILSARLILLNYTYHKDKFVATSRHKLPILLREPNHRYAILHYCRRIS